MTVPTSLADALADRYRLERELGAGGMATVYLAEDLKHHRKVAVKVLRPDLAATLGSERFLREIEVAARLQHPHILTVLDSGDAQGYFYYAMPYVEGETLRDRISRSGELPVHEAVRLLGEIAEALAVAHQAGVVHRDIKPENILLSGRHALVMDFGVAKAVTEASGRQQLTTAGIALGTPAYMAPEQASADPQMDARVDIYAMGVVAYEMLSGFTPFHGLNPQQTLAAHVMRDPSPLGAQRAGLSPTLEAVVMRCLAKRPADRWQSAAEISQQLETLTTPTGGLTPTHTRPIAATPARRRLVPMLAVVGAALLALVAAMSLGKRPERAEFGRQVQLTSDTGLEVEASLSPDGKFIAYVVNDSGVFRLMVRQVVGGEPVMISQAFRLQTAPQWSPDGSRILFRSERGIEVMPALGGRSQLLVPQDSRLVLFPGSWDGSGSEFVYARGDSILIHGADGRSRQVAQVREPHSLAWSPNGKWIAFVSGNRESRLPGISYGNTAPSILMLVPAAGGTVREASLGEGQNLSPAWLSDRTLLFISSRDGARDVYGLSITRDGKPGSPAVRITTGLNAILLSLSPASRKVVYTVYEERSNVWSMPADAATPLSIAQAIQVTKGNQTVERFSVSPDGRLMAYDSDRSGNSDLYLLDLASGETDQLTSDSIAQFAPSWSPDGREIAYHAIIRGVRQIFLMSAPGSPLQITSGTDDLRVPTWTGNGRALYISTNSPNNGYVARMERRDDGSWGAKREMFRTGIASPDERMVFTGRVITSLDGTDTLRQVVPATVPTVRNPVWSRDGSRIYYLAGDAADRTTEIWSVTVAGWRPRLHVRFDDPSRPWHRFGFQVHGNQFYMTLGERESDIWAADINLAPGR